MSRSTLLGWETDHRTSYRRRCDQPCRSTFDTRRVRRLNCRLPTLVRLNPSVFDSKCIRVDDECVSMSGKGAAVELAFRLGFCAWAKAHAAYPRQEGTHGFGRVTQSKRSPEYPVRFSKVTFHGILTRWPPPWKLEIFVDAVKRRASRRRPQDAEADIGRGP